MWQFQNDVKDEVTVDATGMYYTYPDSFQAFAWNEFGVFAYTAWSLRCSFYID